MDAELRRRPERVRSRHRPFRTAATLLVGLVVVFGLTGCETQICGANPILDALFCRGDSSSTPAIPAPPPTPLPDKPPGASIVPSKYSALLGERVTLDGSWSDSDGHVTKFEWDLDDDSQYEIDGVPASDNSDRRSVSFTDDGFHTVRLRVTDDDDLITVETEEVYVGRRQPVAVLMISPARPAVGQEVTFDASASSAQDSTITRYRWDIDGNPSNGYELASTEPVVTRRYTTAGTITVGVRAFDDQGDRGDVRQQLTIGSGATVTTPSNVRAVLLVYPNPAHTGDQVVFDGSGTAPMGSGVTYAWDLDGNGRYERSTGNVARTMRSYSEPATITVRMRATETSGRSTVARATLTITQTRRTSGRSTAAAPAPASGRLFSARLNTRPVRGYPGRVSRRGAVHSLRGTLVSGSFNGRLARVRRASPPAEVLLAKLLRARYRARLDASVDARTRTGTTTMLALATLPRSSRREPPTLACVRITLVERPGRKPSGSFRVLGGTRDATRLSALGTFTFVRGRRAPSAMAGTLKAKLIGARRLPRACVALG